MFSVVFLYFMLQLHANNTLIKLNINVILPKLCCFVHVILINVLVKVIK